MYVDKQFAVSGKWALASDGAQWVLQRHGGNGRWKAISFVRSTKDILARCMREKNCPAGDQQRLLELLPLSFDEWAGREPVQFSSPGKTSVKSATLPSRIVADSQWPGMYRIRWPDGRLSDMVNLARALDALQNRRKGMS